MDELKKIKSLIKKSNFTRIDYDYEHLIQKLK